MAHGILPLPKLQEFRRLVSEHPHFFLVLAFFAVFALLFFKPTVSSGDPYGYFAILQGAARDKTLDLKAQHDFAMSLGQTTISFNEATGMFVSKFAFGWPLLALPAYLAALAVSNFSAFHVKDAFFIEKTGGLLVEQLAVTLTTLLLFFATLLIVYKILLAIGFGRKRSALAVFAGAVSTPILLYYSFISSAPHVAEAFVFSLALYFSIGSVRKNAGFFQGLLLGLLASIRYPSVLAGAFFFQENPKCIAKIFFGMLPFILLLAIYQFVQFGSVLSTGYSSETANFAPFPEFALPMVFDQNFGLLFWSPMVVAGFLGLFFLEDGRLRNGLLASFAAVFLFYAFWPSWSGGWSYGNRFLVVLFPATCIGIASFFKKFPRLVPLGAAACAYSFGLALLFIASTGSIEPNFFSNQAGYWFGRGKIAEFPHMLFEKLSAVRFLMEK